MEKINYKEKGIETKNPSPFLMLILKMQRQREERRRFQIQRIKNLGLKLDKEIVNGHVMQLVDMLGSNPRFCRFESYRAYKIRGKVGKQKCPSSRIGTGDRLRPYVI